MCIGAPESITNSRSSGFRVDPHKHLFSESEKNVAPACSLNSNTLIRGHLALATLSPLETDPQTLERWGYADEVHLGKCIRARDFGLEFQCDVQNFSEFYTLDWSLHVCALLKRLHALYYTTQLSFIR